MTSVLRPCIHLTTMLLILGCATTDSPEQQRLCTSPGDLIRDGKYHEALRQLPATVAEIKKEAESTGKSYAVLSGSIDSVVLGAIAYSGDADWGKILDDPDIPYEYKTAMILDIVETRLGKGAVWSPYWTDIIIVPRKGRLHSMEDVFELLQKAVGERPNGRDPK